MTTIPKIPPGNIWSGDKLRAVFTNPTEIAFRKGNLKSHWPLKFRGQEFADAEEAYKAHKAKTSDKYELCTEILIDKFRQYPVLAETIKANGGKAWIEQCSHHVYDKCTYWEGDGMQSGFIRCLLKAFCIFSLLLS